MQVIYPPSGLQAYPFQGYGDQINQLGNTISSYIRLKDQNEKDKAQKQLELYLRTGEITGRLDEPTPEIQSAFRRIYGMDVPASLKGETIAGQKARADIRTSKAEARRKEAVAGYYERRSAAGGGKTVDERAMDFAVKYANSKLGKPFAVLEPEERELWNQYYDEGVSNYQSASGNSVNAGTTKAPKEYNEGQQAWINRWNAIPQEKKAQALSNPTMRKRVQAELAAIGLTIQDLTRK